MAEPTDNDAALGRLFGTPIAITRNDYRSRRKEILLALLAEHADRLDDTAEEMGAFFDHLRQVGIRGLVAEKLHDPDYSEAAKPQPKRR